MASVRELRTLWERGSRPPLSVCPTYYSKYIKAKSVNSIKKIKFTPAVRDDNQTENCITVVWQKENDKNRKCKLTPFYNEMKTVFAAHKLDLQIKWVCVNCKRKNSQLFT